MFTANTKEQTGEMLKEIGVGSFGDLLISVPKEFLNKKFDIPCALTEIELRNHITEVASKNKALLNFIGAGAYEHFIPAAVDALAGRGEFATAYTPYQPEASQATLQAIYEFQSSICALLDMDVSNASMYDGATALAESVNASVKITSRNKVLFPEGLHPHYKKTLETYFKNTTNIKLEQIPTSGGTIDASLLHNHLDKDTAGVILPTPNFYGCLEDAKNISQKIHENRSLLIALVNPVSLGVLTPPGQYGADFAVAEGQPLGNPLNYGGPYLGIFTCKREFIRYVPGRICAIAKDKKGKRGFVLTLQAREQHIRRERAQSNICSNEALCALNAVIYLSLLGPQGLKELAELNIANAHIAARKISALKGFKLKFDKPFFNEFVVECPIDGEVIQRRLLEKAILVGLPLGFVSNRLENCLLICVTETKSAKDIDRLVSALREVR
jgi:glycine dehydrogenase subunit 1